MREIDVLSPDAGDSCIMREWENGTLYKNSNDLEKSLRSLPSYHIARENPLRTYLVQESSVATVVVKF